MLFPFLLSILISPSHAGAKQCCDTATGSWSEASGASQCESRGPTHVWYVGTNAMQVMACMQSANQQAQQAMANLGDLYPGLTGPGMQTSGPPEPDCCDTRAKQWLGPRAETACRAAGGVPDVPSELAATQACRTPSGGGSGVWNRDDFVDNLPNGGLERWRDENRPESFSSFGVAPELQGADSIDLQTAFRTTDAHTGRYALRLKNFDMTAALKEKGLTGPAVGMVGQLGSPAGVNTCKEPCPIETGKAPTGRGEAAAVRIAGALPVEEALSHVCFAYKGYIAPQDQVYFSVVLGRGASIVGGSALTGSGSTITESSADWVETALPLHTLNNAAFADVDKAGVQIAVQPRGAMGATGSVSTTTDVIVDSLHFCDLVDLSAHHPAVISPSNERLADELELSEGIQVFVNDDNDDQDKAFDLQDTDGVGREDDLAPVVFRLPTDSRGKVTVELTGGSKVKLWNDHQRRTAFSEALGRAHPVLDFMQLSSDGTHLERTFWVEGVEPSSQPRDVRLKVRFDDQRADAPFEDEVAVTVLAVTDVAWEGRKNGLGDSDTLDPDPNWPSTFPGAAVRVFPGRRFEGRKASERRDQVTAAIQLNVKPVRPVPLFVRSFDVDDPTALDDEVDREEQADDNRGTVEGGGGWGRFVGHDGPIAKLSLEEQRTELGFQVTLNPGDSFRLVTSPDRDFLEQLHNDDTVLIAKGPRFAASIVDEHVLRAEDRVASAELRRQDQVASEVLVVWRQLYIEIDSMGPVVRNTARGTVIGARKDSRSTDSSLWVWLKIDANLYDQLPEDAKSGRSGYLDNFTDGTLTYEGDKYRVRGSTANGPGQPDEILVSYAASWGMFLEPDFGKAVTVVDDDAQKEGEALPKLQTERLEPTFGAAYVLPRYDVPNSRSTFPFRAHFLSDEQAYLNDLFRPFFDNVEHEAKADFWVVYLLNAFQGKISEDKDPNDEGAICGQASGRRSDGRGGLGAAVFQESGRESEVAYTAAGAPTGWRMKDVAPHELAHLFGALHSDGGTMSYAKVKTDTFTPLTLHKIRTREHP